MARTWSEKQKEAIWDRENDLLVSAAAGSGKTAVLVERITRLILEDRVPVLQMLVVTFTKAAASEMRERIHKSLRSALSSAEDPETESFLLNQIADLPNAAISNFHSFASKLLREQFATAGVDPAFRVADEVRAGLLKGDALDELFERRFSETGARKEAFLSYLRAYAGSRSEDALREQILTVSAFLDSLPDPEAWLEKAASCADFSRETFLESDAYAFMMHDIETLLAEALEASNELVTFLGANPLYRDNLFPVALQEQKALETAQAAFRRSFDEGIDALRSIEFQTFAARKKDAAAAYKIDKPYVTRLRAVYHNTTGGHAGRMEQILRMYGARSLDDAVQLIRETAPACQTLTDLVREFRALFRARKDAEKLLDFADLEAYALSVLSDEPTREMLQARYRYIFVDEYQDSNRVQEELIRRLHSPLGRLFFVGDVKQSIYRFRLAEPAIFNARMKRYREADGRSNERVVDLNRNFRSEGSILSAINALFETLMEPTVSAIQYDETQALIPGTDDAEKAKTPVELHILRPRESRGEKDSEDTETPSPLSDDLVEIEAEARLAAELIRRDLGKPYYDFREKREVPLRPSDVVILLRAMTHADAYEAALLNAGIPAISEAGESYYDTIEIAVFLNLLTVIDNLRSDEALLSVLYSPLYRFTADELAEIRIFTKDASYADALLRYADEGPSEPLRRRAIDFLASLERLREDARFLPLGDFLWSLMIGSGYYHYIGALPAGTLRQANLRALIEKAVSYEESGGKGLPGWIRFVRAMKNRNLTVAPQKPESEISAVRIMTIHKSKGLEFPYVLIGRVAKSLSAGKRGTNLPLSADGLIALPYVNKTAHAKSETLLASVLNRREAFAERAEELRVLYVAMTRARHKLVMVGSITKSAFEAVETGAASSRGGVMPAGSYLDWLLGSEAFLREIGSPVFYRYGEGFPALKTGHDEILANEAALRTGFGTPPSAFKEELARRLLWTYPFEKATETPSKTTVTQINRASDGKVPYRAPLAIPQFARTGERISFTGAQRGTLLHRVLEHIPFKNDWTEEGIRRFIDEMTQRAFFTPEEAKAIPVAAILRFFRSPLGLRAIEAASSGTLYRETDFTLLLSDGETVQGTIDLFFRDAESRWVLVDYKSNYAEDTEEDAAELLDSYRSQLLLYKRALEQIKRISLSEVYLYAFSLGRALPLENACGEAENRR